MSQLPIMSVSGIRGIVGETLTNKFCASIAYIQTKYLGAGKIIVGRDTRTTGPQIAQAIFAGIRAAGGTPIDIGIAPTPTTCFAVDHFNASGGVIITASHNPHPYNGYKMVHTSARLFSGAECDAVYQQYHQGNYPSWEELQKYMHDEAEQQDAVKPHIEAICSAVDTKLIAAKKIRVAVDSINGAAGVIFPALLDRLGVSWQGVHNELSGDFTHNPEPRPEHLQDLASLLRSSDDFWAGFAFDPDADRLAPMGENGQPISEEMTLALALESVLKEHPSDIATNLSTSMVIDDVAAKYGVKVFRSKIGEANVVGAMQEHGCTIGGEGNGGVIYPRVSTVRDGLTALALIIECMAKRDQKIFDLASQWPVYPGVKEKIELGDLDPAEVIQGLEQQFVDEKTDTQDGLKIIRDYGWVHLRPSNTEPIMRCYAEAKTEKQARELADMVMEKVKR
ncbi:MAG: phosphoglucosamine mutase [Chitinivibrionales bacterium]